MEVVQRQRWHTRASAELVQVQSTRCRAGAEQVQIRCRAGADKQVQRWYRAGAN